MLRRLKQAGCQAAGSRCLVAVAMLTGALAACGDGGSDGSTVAGTVTVTISGSAVGAEAELLDRQLARFHEQNPSIVVERRETPDAADQRHQLYVQWLNGGARDPDVLQLDVIWTPEFAAAGWIAPLDRFQPDTSDFFDATLNANRVNGRLYALPWFVDAGMLYYRTDLVDEPPASLQELTRSAASAVSRGDVRHGFLWQGARYEGLVTVFLEHLAALGGKMLDERGNVLVDSAKAVSALERMRSYLAEGVSPQDVLSWREEQVRLAFQNGDAAYMRNWPYAWPMLQDPSSPVAGRVAVMPFPAGAGGRPASVLGGQQLALNAASETPDAAWRVIEFLLEPARMEERARVAGQYPPRPSLYEGERLGEALGIGVDTARHIIGSAVPRPTTPYYSELSGILQIGIHRALSGQAEPRDALAEAAVAMREVLARAAPHTAAGGDG